MEPLRSHQLVLIADDNPINLDVVCTALAREQLDLAVASDGQMALELVHNDPPDLILLDVQMPVMDGFEACRRLKADAATRDIPVIFMTSHNELDHRVRGLRLGAVDYISKPFEEAELLARVKTQLALRRLTRTLQIQNAQLEKQNTLFAAQLRQIEVLQQNLECEKIELLKINQELMRSREQAAEVFEAMSEMLPGQILDGKYRVEGRIGSGGFGVVYRATHVTLQRPVALKVLCPHSELSLKEHLSYFRTEGISASRLNHPSAVVIFDANTANGVAYLAMELLEGHTLAQDLNQQHCMSLGRCSQIIVPVCEVLAYAHSVGVVHCDIKPGNIFLHQSPSGDVVKVLDFGIAKLLSNDAPTNRSELARSALVLGTPPFIAPERLRGEPYDSRVDVYSIGVMLMLMLCGFIPLPQKVPVDPAASQESLWNPGDLQALIPSLPHAVAALIVQAIAQNPAQRPSMKEFLEGWRQGVPATSSTAPAAVGEGAVSAGENADLPTITL